MPPKDRPGFIESWLTDLADDVKRYGKHKLLPWKLALCLIAGTALAMLAPHKEFWGKPEVSVVFFTAIVTVDGLLLALSWGSFGKIYEIASEQRIATFLRRNNLFDGYVFQVDFIHFVQITALLASGFALVISVVELPHALDHYFSLSTARTIAMALSLGMSGYALIYATGAVRLMQDLVWYSSQIPFDRPDSDMTVHHGGRGTRE